MSVATSVAGRWPGTLAVPEAVVHPESVDDVADTIRRAAADRIGVAVVASGRRFHGPRSLDRPFMVLSTDRLRGTEIYEPADLTLTAKAGTPLAALADELDAHAQWLPYDPPDAAGRTLGGLVATGESGPLCTGYGELRNHVFGLSMVCGDGRTLRLGGRVVKNVAGFDLLKAVVGSRGSLGVITSVCVRAFPRPATDRVLVLKADSPARLATAALRVGTAPLMPVSSVLIAPARALSAGAALLVRLHGGEPAVEADQRTLERHCSVSFERAPDRDSLLAAARDHASDGALLLRISLLPSRLAEGLVAVEELLGDVDIAVDTYAGSLRVATRDVDVAAAARLRARVASLGGVVGARVTSGDVDVTSIRSRPSAAAAALTERLERVFDPQGVLWPCRP